MRTGLDCLVCFMRQALSAARLSIDDPGLHRQVINEAGKMLAHVELDKSPPENAVFLYRLIAEITGKTDPFADLKKQSNAFALSIRDRISEQIAGAGDSLRAAIHFAACANIIDYGAQHSFDAGQAMAECVSQSFVVDDYSSLMDRLQNQKKPKILYLADNCGEIVFDGLVIRELQNIGCEVTLAVRGAAIINDAVMDDAITCGLTSICRVIDNGTGCPGTPLAGCSDEFRKIFAAADIIVSKGMGNFETLSEIDAPLFFLFTVKCSRVASHLRKVINLKDQEINGTGEMVFICRQRMEDREQKTDQPVAGGK